MEIRENRPHDGIMLGDSDKRYVLWTKDEFVHCNYMQIASFFCNHPIAVLIESEELNIYGGNELWEFAYKKNLGILLNNPEIEGYEIPSIEKIRIDIPKTNKLFNWCVKHLFQFHLRETIAESEALIEKLKLEKEISFEDFLIEGVKTEKFKWNGMSNEQDLKNAGLL